MIKAWSKTQNSISLSSAEAELIAMVKLSTELLGLMSLARDLNCRLHGRVWADSSAALAIVKRSGAGKLRHINISLLWVQEQEKLKKLVYEKVPGQANPADLFTKGVGREKLQQFAWASGQTFLDGRAEKSLQAQGVCVLQVADTCGPSKGQVALRTAQSESKMSESAHAEFMKIHATTKHRQRAIRTIGAMQTSCIAPERQQNPQRNCRGGVVGQCGSLVDGVSSGDRDRVLQVSVGYKTLCMSLLCVYIVCQ